MNKPTQKSKNAEALLRTWIAGRRKGFTTTQALTHLAACGLAITRCIAIGCLQRIALGGVITPSRIAGKWKIPAELVPRCEVLIPTVPDEELVGQFYLIARKGGGVDLRFDCHNDDRFAELGSTILAVMAQSTAVFAAKLAGGDVRVA